MGGGDLNLKKSWHPHTMKNQEKVWKAEQAKTQEEKKLNDLRREIEEEKNRDELKRIGRESGVLCGNSESDKKLDWMYKSSTELINREEYLLGRKIDKSFEILQAEEKEQHNIVGVKQTINHVEHECVPFSIRAYKNLHNSEQVDLQRKVMEDPLMLIKQREIESRRKILENPVKLKELHRILKTDEKLRNVSKKLKKSKKSKKSKKKHKKRNRSSCSSNNGSHSESDLDTKLAKKLQGGLLKDENTNFGVNLSKLLDSKFEKISQELDKAAGRSKKRSQKKTNRDSDSSPISDYEQSQVKRRPYLFSKQKTSQKGNRPKSVSKDREKMYNKYENRRSRSPDSRKNSSKKQESRHRSHSRSQDKAIKKAQDRKRSRSSSRKKEVKSRQRSRGRSRSPVRKEKIQRESRNNSKTREHHTANHSRSSDRKDIYRRETGASASSRQYRNEKKHNARSRSKSRDDKIRSISKSRSSSYIQTSSSTNQRSSKLTDEEKQAKLREMMSNAAWREEDRTEAVRKNREACAQEEERHRTQAFDKDFLNKEIKKALDNQNSMGSRLRANMNNIQRSSAAMDSNFARK